MASLVQQIIIILLQRYPFSNTLNKSNYVQSTTVVENKNADLIGIRSLRMHTLICIAHKMLCFTKFKCSVFLLQVSLATFAVYVMIGNELNAEKAFVAISLFNILQFPLTILPMIVTRIIAVSAV